MHKEAQTQHYQSIKLTRQLNDGNGLIFLSSILATGGLMGKLQEGRYDNILPQNVEPICVSMVANFVYEIDWAIPKAFVCCLLSIHGPFGNWY